MPRVKRVEIRKCKWAAGSRYLVDLGRIKQGDGSSRRIRRFFRTHKAAEIYLADQKGKLEKHGHTAVALADDDRVVFQGARDRLARAGASITHAVEYFLAHHRELKEPITLRELVEKCVLDKELAGARKRYLQTFACSCRAFARGWEECQVQTVTRDDVKAWILGGGYAPKTQKNYLGDLREAFAWAVREGYLAVNPIAGRDGFIPLEEEADSEIVALDLGQCAALLKTALLGTHMAHGRAGTDRWVKRPEPGGFRCMIGYLAVAMFAGVRPDEIKRTQLAKLNTRERTIVITGKSAKTRQRRVIELDRVAVA